MGSRRALFFCDLPVIQSSNILVLIVVLIFFASIVLNFIHVICHIKKLIYEYLKKMLFKQNVLELLLVVRYGSRERLCIKLFFLMPLSRDHELIYLIISRKRALLSRDNEIIIPLSRENKRLFPLISCNVYITVC